MKLSIVLLVAFLLQSVGLKNSTLKKKEKGRSIDGFMSEGVLTLTNSVGTKAVQHAALCDGFEGRTPQGAVHSLPQEVAVTQL